MSTENNTNENALQNGGAVEDSQPNAPETNDQPTVPKEEVEGASLEEQYPDLVSPVEIPVEEEGNVPPVPEPEKDSVNTVRLARIAHDADEAFRSANLGTPIMPWDQTATEHQLLVEENVIAYLAGKPMIGLFTESDFDQKRENLFKASINSNK